uniref:Uncharacterized protein n=1 Tax=Cacopsylla melanoneura TaxID=428564 RepID=A0A8D9AZ45_9HEMI
MSTYNIPFNKFHHATPKQHTPHITYKAHITIIVHVTQNESPQSVIQITHRSSHHHHHIAYHTPPLPKFTKHTNIINHTSSIPMKTVWLGVWVITNHTTQNTGHITYHTPLLHKFIKLTNIIVHHTPFILESRLYVYPITITNHTNTQYTIHHH